MQLSRNSVVFLSLALGAACGPGLDSQSSSSALRPELDALAFDVGFTRFADLMDSSGLSAELRAHPGEVTILVPEVPAFDAYLSDPSTVNDDQLILVYGLLSQHVLEGRHQPHEVAVETRSTWLPGIALAPASGGALRNVNGAQTVPTGRWWPARNGNLVEVTQVIGPALTLENYLAEEGFSLFQEAVWASGFSALASWDTKATVLVPPDGAFLAAGLDETALRAPENQIRAAAIVEASVLEAGGWEGLYVGGLEAINGRQTWIETVYDPQQERAFEMLFQDGVAWAPLHDDYGELPNPNGALVVIDGIVDPKAP